MTVRQGAGVGSLAGALLAQAGAGVDPEIDAAADRVPFGGDRHGLADDVQVAPALGKAALALERRAAAVTVHQIHRLARAVGGVGRGQAAAGALLEGGGTARRDYVPQFGDHRGAVGAARVQDRVGPSDRVLDLGVVA